MFAHSNDNFRPFTSVSVPNDVSQDQRTLMQEQKRPMLGAKETYNRSKRDLVKSPVRATKEAKTYGKKRPMCMTVLGQKRPTCILSYIPKVAHAKP